MIMNDLSVAVDGIIYRLQARGDISRVFNEILPRMCALDDRLRITLYHTRYRQQALPMHEQIVPVRVRTLDRVLHPASPVWGRWQPQAANWSGTAEIVGRAGLKHHIWHSTYYTMPPVWRGPKVISVYDLCQENFPEFFTHRDDERVRRMKQHSLEMADAVLCISDSTRAAVEAYYRVASIKLHVVSLAGSPLFRQLADRTTTDRPVAEPFILFVGARYHYKNYAELLEAYSQWSQNEEIALVLVGSALTEAEQRELAALGLLNRVHLLSGISDEALCELYNDALAFVYPSLCEGFGIPLLEAMACGCPVIASRIPSTEEVAGTIPFYFEPGEPGSLLAALDTAVTAGRDAAVQRGLDEVRRFSWDETARQVLAVYRGLA